MSFVSLKHDEVFSVTNEYGDITPESMGSGVYFKDTQYLNRYELRMNGEKSIFLSRTNKDVENRFTLSNGDIQTADAHYEKMDLEINRSQFIFEQTFYDRIELKNGSLKQVTCNMELLLQPVFHDLFEVRGAKREKRGEWGRQSLSSTSFTVKYEGLDHIKRNMHVAFSEGGTVDGTNISYPVHLEPGACKTVDVKITVYQEEEVVQPSSYDVSVKEAKAERDQWLETSTRIKTNNPAVNTTLETALYDMHMLATDVGYGPFPVAGIPWFCVPFGRDSMIAAIQTLILNPELAKSTLRTLANVQGEKEDDWNDEAPGKILHETRQGEMANLKEVPFSRYYGSIDGTPLFLILLSETYRWTGDRSLLEDLMPAAERCLDYLDQFADLDGDGFIEFHKKSEDGLTIQSWKDSNHSMVHKDGSPSDSPMAVSEVQGYVYDAKIRMAEIYGMLGRQEKENQLKNEATSLKEKFNSSFWMENEKYFALSLDKEKSKVETITSDPGHALWSGVIDKEKRDVTADRLLSEDLFSGWGIRTMSKDEKVYSPIAYHNGTVWPHDNSLIALGLAKYGFKAHLNKLVQALFDSSKQFEENRLPELFCGYPEEETNGSIIPFPVACSPQAWAAGTPYACIQALLGIQVNNDHSSIQLSPTLPEDIDWIEIENLQIGDRDGTLDFIVQKQGNGEVEVVTKKNTTGLDISVE
ncbi:amylo-alpha-1,6-glucosidase [Texcoconibacillus texcoconensis]|uniref:Glycogen debranching enzyme n=1 Tax=Texcoconibacillus texcoconensis TaxID=1095777 RepID=A0A840QRE0_9BACI|nr:amylo-alpha-1,6-glucosidase [Texcoconibacillus texcoconensis]MBB5173893.1 glycogen debranching enzyme [Texcoconibacillus texcoconensis]